MEEIDKKRKKYILFGKIGYYFSKIVYKTLRIKVYKNEKYTEGKNYIYAFWHGKLFLPMVNMTRNGNKIANMVSPSNDGQIIATMLEMYGYKTIRGSSNKDSVRSLVEMIKTVRSGYSGGFAVDGPRGPIFKIKPGVIYTAQKTGIEIVPLTGYFDRKWIIEKAWDKFQFPKPFSKAVYIIGEPIKIDENEDTEKMTEKLENILLEMDLEAQKLLK